MSGVVAVMRQMRKNFQKNLSANRSPTQLLLFVLKQMARVSGSQIRASLTASLLFLF